MMMMKLSDGGGVVDAGEVRGAAAVGVVAVLPQAASSSFSFPKTLI